MKKIFILTGEPSGDKLASKVIAQLKNSRSDIEYLSVGGEHLKSLGISFEVETHEKLSHHLTEELKETKAIDINIVQKIENFGTTILNNVLDEIKIYINK